MTGWSAQRLSKLPPYLFVEIDRRKRAALAAGRDVIDFGVGDPDLPTFPPIVERAVESIQDPVNHRYASTLGMIELRRTIAGFFSRRFGVTVDPQTEVLVLLGSKEGIGHLPTAVIDPGDVVLIPEPGYPVYTSGTIFAGGEVHTMPLREESAWLPLLGDVARDVRSRAKLMWLNYPNNPTAAVAPFAFFEEAMGFAREYGVLIAQDAAYSEVYFNDPPPSILQVPGAKEWAIEFHSLSKTFNMTGWRIAFVVGNADALAALAKVKSNLDSGVFQALQQAAITALERTDSTLIRKQVDVYRRRRDVLVDGLRRAGWRVDPPPATFYAWVPCPGGQGSMAVATRLLEEASVVVIPGVGFGAGGEGYVRFALTVSEDRTGEAVERIGKLRW